VSFSLFYFIFFTLTTRLYGTASENQHILNQSKTTDSSNSKLQSKSCWICVLIMFLCTEYVSLHRKCFFAQKMFLCTENPAVSGSSCHPALGTGHGYLISSENTSLPNTSNTSTLHLLSPLCSPGKALPVLPELKSNCIDFVLNVQTRVSY